jgi:hypothetical protein
MVFVRVVKKTLDGDPRALKSSCAFFSQKHIRRVLMIQRVPKSLTNGAQVVLV